MGEIARENIRKSSKKRTGWLVVSLALITLVLLWYNSALTRIEKENKHRTFVFQAVVTGIESYYQSSKEYPAHISGLALQYQNIVDDFIKAGVFEYYRDPSGKEWFSLTCRF